MGPDVQYSSERPLDPLKLEIYRGCDAAFTLYEDDGETSAYLNGAFAETRFEMTDTAEALIFCLGESRGSFAGHQLQRTILLNIHKQPLVNSVYCDNFAVPAVPAAYSQREGGFRLVVARREADSHHQTEANNRRAVIRVS